MSALIAHSHIGLLEKVSLIALQQQEVIFVYMSEFRENSMTVALTFLAVPQF
jgi:hypothetical protein